MPKFTASIDGFNASYIPEPNSGCWLWEKSVNNRGYGLLQCGGFRGYAHRFSYATFKGDVPAGMHVCHRCDMPICVNPDHLWLGTASDNMRDCVSKSRHASDSPDTNYAIGDRQGLSKLTVEDVVAIRSLGGQLSQRKIATRFGVTKNAVKLILQRRTWRHV